MYINREKELLEKYLGKDEMRDKFIWEKEI
jgi:hypothetical protein